MVLFVFVALIIVENTGDLETADGLMKHGLEVQDKSKDSLQRTLRVVHETKVIGQDTVVKLEQNTEQIQGMYDKLESIETTLQRSTKIIKIMARKVATDKYIWVIAFIVFGVIIFIIVWKAMHNSSSSSSPSLSSSSTGAAGR